MEILLLALAMAIMIFAGAGVSLILFPRAKLIELIALSFLFGTTFVSIASFATGFLFSGSNLRLVVTGLCVLVGLWGLHRRERIQGRCDGVEWRWVVLAVILTGFISYLSYRRELGWDGLLVFEMKARLAFLNGGVIPSEYFSDSFRGWSHLGYPLLLPLCESWIYLWLGRADQQLVKILFPMFFTSALVILYVANRRKDWSLLFSPLLLMTAPQLWLGNGSATSGYADFPMAVFYLGAIVYLLKYQQTRDLSDLRLVGFLLAAGCWLKREGVILWLCVLVITAIKAVKSFRETEKLEKGAGARKWMELKRLVYLVLPGLAIIVICQSLLHAKNLVVVDDFRVDYESLQGNLSNAPTIVSAICIEFVNWSHWGMLWPISAIVAIWLVVKQRRFILPFTVYFPIVIYCGIYFFSKWSDYLSHIESSFPRLLIHISLTAILMITSSDSKKDSLTLQQEIT